MRERWPCVYILASQRNSTLYIGVTSDITARISIHKQDLIDGFTRRYGVYILVYVEQFDTMQLAIAREKQRKKWGRARKIALIEQHNPAWRDLYTEVSGLIEPKSVPRLA